jgi:hypoxanthine phosphoribosyltransferase
MTDVESFNCKVVAWDEIDTWAKNVVKKIRASDFKPDLIVALIRGGLVPARLICDHLHLKNLYAVKVEHWGITAGKDMKAKLIQGLDLDLSGKKVLVVDDITDTGESMRLATNHLKEKGPAEIRSATLLHIAHSSFEPDFFDVHVPKDQWTWFIFPWNLHEDLRTLASKTLTCAKAIDEITFSMMEQFNIDVDDDLVEGALLELVERGQVSCKDGKWEKCE